MLTTDGTKVCIEAFTPPLNSSDVTPSFGTTSVSDITEHDEARSLIQYLG
jgi:hypothetical protein